MSVFCYLTEIKLKQHQLINYSENILILKIINHWPQKSRFSQPPTKKQHWGIPSPAPYRGLISLNMSIDRHQVGAERSHWTNHWWRPTCQNRPGFKSQHINQAASLVKSWRVQPNRAENQAPFFCIPYKWLTLSEINMLDCDKPYSLCHDIN